ncbi:hypothetical protein DUI70_4173 [Streptomyces albus]|nr:hypothetical protein DUI70_4173 [Streptomyces albus]
MGQSAAGRSEQKRSGVIQGGPDRAGAIPSDPKRAGDEHLPGA